MRSKFLIPPAHPDEPEGSRSTYLCGNSLGVQPVNTRQYICQELDDWEKYGVEGHWKAKRPWLTTDEFTYMLMAEVVGAQPEEVAVMNSLTVNLHMMMVPFYRPTKERSKIIIEGKAFPSDLYAMESQVRLHGFDPETSLIQLFPRFHMDAPFQPIPGAFRYRLSNPPVFQMASLLASLELFHEATMEKLRAKSEMLTGYLELLVNEEISKDDVIILTPSDPAQRGCQLSLFFKGDGVATAVNDRLIQEGGICDVRKPDVIRAAPVPLYNTFSDVRKFVDVLKATLA